MNHMNAGDWQARLLPMGSKALPRLGALARLGALWASLDAHASIVRLVVLLGFVLLLLTTMFLLP